MNRKMRKKETKADRIKRELREAQQTIDNFNAESFLSHYHPILVEKGYGIVICERCGRHFISKSSVKKFCSSRCQMQAKTIRYREKKGSDET